MANGKSGDHPLTDILTHGHEVYGKEADDLIKKIAKLCTRPELDAWWQKEIGWDADPKSVQEKAAARYGELAKRAKESGWE